MWELYGERCEESKPSALLMAEMSPQTAQRLYNTTMSRRTQEKDRFDRDDARSRWLDCMVCGDYLVFGDPRFSTCTTFAFVVQDPPRPQLSCSLSSSEVLKCTWSVPMQGRTILGKVLFWKREARPAKCSAVAAPRGPVVIEAPSSVSVGPNW